MQQLSAANYTHHIVGVCFYKYFPGSHNLHIRALFLMTGLFQVFCQPLSENLLSMRSPSSSLHLSPSQSSEEGAFSPIYCAVAEETEGITGKYFDSDCSLVLPAPLARDPALAVKDFEICERVTSKLWKNYKANNLKGAKVPLMLDVHLWHNMLLKSSLASFWSVFISTSRTPEQMCLFFIGSTAKSCLENL